MNETEWARMVSDVIRGVDPEAAEVRRRVHQLLADDGTLGVLRRAALAGCDLRSLVQVLRCLALPIASMVKLEGFSQKNGRGD